MNEITLDTPLSRIVLTDKLRTRLRMLKCNTFREAMETDPAEWENVSPKVVNAMKRFKQDYSDVYMHLLEHPGDTVRAGDKGKVEMCGSDKIMAQAFHHHQDEERRFFVANNLLNAYVSSGLMANDEVSVDACMKEIMRQTDAFMKAYNSVSENYVSGEKQGADDDLGRKHYKVHQNVNEGRQNKTQETIEDSRRVTTDVRVGRPCKKDDKGNREQPRGALSIGDTVQFTVYHGIRSPIGRKFQVGDIVKVTDVSTRLNGVIEAMGVMGGKVASFDSKKYSWNVIATEPYAPVLSQEGADMTENPDAENAVPDEAVIVIDTETHPDAGSDMEVETDIQDSGI